MDFEQAVDTIRRSILSGQSDLLINQLLPSTRVVVHDAPADDGHVGSHFGGLPCLPPDFTWPVWDQGDFLRGQIARLEEKFRNNPRATGLRDIAARMGADVSRGPRPLPFLAQLDLGAIQSTAALSPEG